MKKSRFPSVNFQHEPMAFIGGFEQPAALKGTGLRQCTGCHEVKNEKHFQKLMGGEFYKKCNKCRSLT